MSYIILFLNGNVLPISHVFISHFMHPTTEQREVYQITPNNKISANFFPKTTLLQYLLGEIVELQSTFFPTQTQLNAAADKSFVEKRQQGSMCNGVSPFESRFKTKPSATQRTPPDRAQLNFWVRKERCEAGGHYQKKDAKGGVW